MSTNNKNIFSKLNFFFGKKIEKFTFKNRMEIDKDITLLVG